MIGGSLCSGSGGLDLGLGRALDVEWAWHAEIDAAASLILDAHWPGVPNLGDFTEIRWEDVPRVELFAAGFPCFVAGTLILTRDGYRPIETLVVGDLVLTHEGRWRPVSFCHETSDAPVRRICAPGVNLVCTDEHPFYARRARYEQGCRVGLDAAEWRDASDLAPEDFLGQTLPPVEASEARPLAFWRIIGRYLADGWMVDRRGRKNGRVVICCANDELDGLRALVADAGYTAALERGESASKLHITHGDLYDFVRSFGRLAHGKMLPGFVHALGQEESEAILSGYLAGDGYYDEPGRCWRSTTVSEQLAYGLALLAQRARGVVASVHPYDRAGETEIAGRTVRQRPEWQVRIPFSNRSCFVEDGYGWKKMKRNERLTDRVTVYNIAVEEDESYVANGAIVHNCPDYSLAGRRAGIDGEHGQVWHSVARALRALRPSIVVLENVDGIRSASGPVGGGPGDTALGVVLADLADLGYRWAYDRMRAADVGAPHGRLRWFCVAALPSAADALGLGDDSDGRVRGRDQGTPGRRGSASSPLPAGPEVDVAEDALEDGPGAPADAERERLDGGGVGDAGPPAGGGEDRGAVASRLAAPARLLPTPVVTDSFGSRRSTARTEEWTSNPGTSLTDAIWETQGRDTDTRGKLLPTPTAEDGERGRAGAGSDRLGAATFDDEVRLLPTPQAADGVGGRMERGAMERDGKRPSGHKATLPLPTAVEMRDSLSETPFAQDAGDDQLVLLPTPVANPENPGAGGELRAAVVHGEGRRNETGVDTLGRPNEGRPSSKLLPTPTTQDAANTAGESQRDRHSDPLNVVAADLDPQLLPTPRVTSERNSRKAMVENQQWSSVSLAQATEIANGILPREFESWDEVPGDLGKKAREQLLPTPQAADGERSSEQGPRHYSTGGDNPTLLGAARRAEVEWGVYEPAVRRWEAVFGYPAPTPTDEKGRLAPEFVEWMLGYPPGWFDIPGIARTKKLRALGNSVQVQCAEAVGYWLAGLIRSGLLLEP